MRVDYQVGLLYEEGMKQIVSSADNWKAVCRMTGRLYRYEFDNFLMVYMEVVGPYDNSVKDQGEEAELTLITCENKGTMRLIVKCRMQEVVE